MSSAQEIDVLEHEAPHDAEEEPSAIPKPESGDRYVEDAITVK